MKASQIIAQIGQEATALDDLSSHPCKVVSTASQSRAMA